MYCKFYSNFALISLSKKIRRIKYSNISITNISQLNSTNFDQPIIKKLLLPMEILKILQRMDSLLIDSKRWLKLHTDCN